MIGPDVVAGFYSLSAGGIAYNDAPERLSKGLPRYPVPLVVLARLAVDRRFHGRGLGAGLLADALRRTLAAAELAGVRGILVHAKDGAAKAFYEHFGFEPFPGHPFTLYRLLKDVRRMLLRDQHATSEVAVLAQKP
jgi:GNAT superfamily N-acetyltransferase